MYLSVVRKVFVDNAENYNATRVLVIMLSLGVILGQFPSTKVFALTPDGILNKFQIYTLLTTTFVEVNMFIGVCHVCVALFAGAFLEERWTTIRFAKFVAIVGLGSQTVVLFTMTFMYYLTFQEPYLYDPLCGFSCVAGGFTVAIAQHLYGKELPNVPMFTFQYFPLFSFIFTFFAWNLGAPHKELWLVAYGIYFGWFYLRYFDLHPITNEVGGDDRDEFELARLFPPILRIPVQIVGAITHNFFASIGCCKTKPVEKPKPAGKPPISPKDVPVFSAVVDAEIHRKRAEAIQAIEERIQLINKKKIDSTLQNEDLPPDLP